MAWLALASCALLALLRWSACLSFSEPVLFETSGTECEALFGIWRTLQGEPIYSLGLEPPYVLTWLNWLFYVLYAAWSQLWLSLLGLEDAWLPVIGRLLSLLFTALSAGWLYRCARELGAQPRAAALTAGLATLTPLGQFFSVTVRPDWPALALECFALLWALRYVRRRDPWALAAATLACFVSWSFKHSSVVVITGLCLWLIVERRWRELFACALGTFALYGLSFGLGGETYRFGLLGSQANQSWQPQGGLLNALKASAKAPLLPVGFLAALWGLRRPEGRRGELGLLAWTTAFGFLWTAALTSKSGAHTYYLLPALCVGTLYASRTLGPKLLAPGCVAQLVVALAIASGQLSVITPPRPYDLARLRDNLAELPGPVLVGYRPGNVPWVQQRPPHFVYAYTYWVDRSAGREHEGGGLAGWIRERRLGTIVLREENDPPVFDDQPVRGYRRVKVEGGLAYWVRQN